MQPLAHVAGKLHEVAQDGDTVRFLGLAVAYAFPGPPIGQLVEVLNVSPPPLLKGQLLEVGRKEVDKRRLEDCRKLSV